MTVTLFGHSFDHIKEYKAYGNPITVYIVRVEDGYYIRKPQMEAGIYKTVTSIYATDDFDAIIIIPASELPEDAVIMGGVTPPTETE